MGSGLAPEGIENNEVMYEMMTDAMWTSNTIDISSWTLKYANARYGIDDPSLRKAWELLDKTVYGGSFFNFRHVLQCRPSLNASSNVKDTASIREILRLMLEAPPEAWKSRLFHNDLIDIATRFLAIRADVRLMNACAAERAGASPLRDSLASQALNLMERIDAILGARLDNTLGRWIAAAKTCAADPVESRQFEQNARMQLTIWGGPELYDYASKLWGGMVGGFYAGRWKAFFEALRAGESDDSIRVHLVKWEEQWTMQTGPCESRAVTDLRAEVERDLRDESLMLDLTPTPVISASAPVFLKGDSVVVRIGGYRPEVRIRYSVLDKSGAIHWKPYERPFIVHATTKIAAIASSPGMVESLPSELAVYEVDSTNGLRASYFETSVINLSEWKHDSAPMWTGVVFGVGLEEVHHRQDKYVVEYEGEVLIQTEGEYAFSLTSDDGSRLWLDGRLLVDNDGLHGTLEKRGKQNLAKGMHEIRVEYFQAGGGATLCLQCAGPGTGFETISPRVLFRP